LHAHFTRATRYEVLPQAFIEFIRPSQYPGY
jgi:hypothetical protein